MNPLRTLVVGLLLAAAGVGQQVQHSRVTFDNQSGERAVVKLVGPGAQAVEVPNAEKRTVNLAPGEYYLLVRYGADPQRQTYLRGNSFKVEEKPPHVSVITITLHKVAGGSYLTKPTSREEFDKAEIPDAELPADRSSLRRVTESSSKPASVTGRVVGVALEGELLNSEREVSLTLLRLKGLNEKGEPEVEVSIKNGEIDAPNAKAGTTGGFTFTHVQTGQYVVMCQLLEPFAAGFLWSTPTADRALVVRVGAKRQLDLGSLYCGAKRTLR